MKKNVSILYSLILVVGDFLALVAAFVTAYILRVKYDVRPLVEQIPSKTYLYGFLTVLPLWIMVLGFIGLYRKEIYDVRFREFGRLILGSILGILVIIGYDFVIEGTLFPARLVAVYGLFLSFSYLLIFRVLARTYRSVLFGYGRGVNNVLIIGDTPESKSIIKELENTRKTGYRILGIVTSKKSKHPTYKTFDEAVSATGPDNIHSIIQVEMYKNPDQNDAIMFFAQSHHIAYKFVPGSSELFVGNIEVQLFRGSPVVSIHQTPLMGWGRIIKRLFDIVVSFSLLVLLSPIFLLLSLLQKISDPSDKIFFTQYRLTQFDRKFLVYKFRTHKKAFNGLTDEEAFEKIGKPELIEEYRAGGDKLANDPRISKFGKFLRTSSLDELPQLFNVLKGDISLVGPRALVPQELKNYTQKHNILSIKSGLTGLAQVSGRRNLGFEERRKLDLYYVQNWSFWLDITILLRTLRAVINGIGAK